MMEPGKMVNTCADGHARIIYETPHCPVCILRESQQRLVEAYEDELEELNKIMDGMVEKNNKMKEVCICGKLAE